MQNRLLVFKPAIVSRRESLALKVRSFFERIRAAEQSPVVLAKK